MYESLDLKYNNRIGVEMNSIRRSAFKIRYLKANLVESAFLTIAFVFNRSKEIMRKLNLLSENRLAKLICNHHNFFLDSLHRSYNFSTLAETSRKHLNPNELSSIN